MTSMDEHDHDSQDEPDETKSGYTEPRQCEHAATVLTPEIFKHITTIEPISTYASEVATQLLRPTHATELLTTYAKIFEHTQLIAQNESTRLAITQLVSSATGWKELLDVSIANLAPVVLAANPSALAAISSIRNSSTLLNMKLTSDANLTKVASALSNINASIGSAAATIPAGTTMTTTGENSYGNVARRLIEDLNLACNQELPPSRFTIDATAPAAPYDLIREAAPDVATKIDEAADRTGTSFADRKVIRYSLAALVYTFILLAFVATTADLDIIPQPWCSALNSAVAGSATGIPAAIAIARNNNKKGDDSPKA